LSVGLLAGVALVSAVAARGDELEPLRQSLTLHASFDEGLNADFSRGATACVVQEGADTVPAALDDDLRLIDDGRFGGALRFTRKSGYRPQFAGPGVLDYHAENWSATVSVWLKLNPDRELEPGYCDPVQILGDDTKKGFIFLEWSKDHSPRQFRFAVRPLVEIWNPRGVGWEEIPDAQRPMVKVERAPFSSETWTHAVFTLERLNAPVGQAKAKLFLNGRLQGAIENWDLRLGWTPEQVRLVLGAAYVGGMDDLSVFNRALTDAEVARLHNLPGGAGALRK